MENTDMIGKRIKDRRKELHLTQKDIFNATKITGGNLSEIENGKYLPASGTLISLSEILGCSIDWILTGNIRKSDLENLENETVSSENRILSKFKKLNDKEKVEIENFIDYKLSIQNQMGLSSTSTNGNSTTKDNAIIA